MGVKAGQYWSLYLLTILARCRAADSLSVEADVSPDLSIEQDSELPQLKNTTERKLMAKIDLYILPMLSILYLLAFLDR